MQNTTDLIKQLKEILGVELLSFMLAVNTKELDRLIPNALQSDALSKLAPLVKSLGGKEGIDLQMNTGHVLCSYRDELNTSWATYFHYRCLGASVPGFEDVKDSAEQSLMAVARDVYPVCLVKKGRDGTHASSFGLIYGHPLNKQFSLAITKASNPIRKLFPGVQSYKYYKSQPASLLSVSTNIILSNGLFNTVSLGMLLESIIFSSTIAPNSRIDEAVQYANNAQATYRKVKRLANGQEVKLSTIVGLGNVDLDPSLMSITAPGGVSIRGPSQVDLHGLVGDVGEISVVIELQAKVSVLKSYNTTGNDSKDPFAVRYGDDDRNAMIDKNLQSLQNSIDRTLLAMILVSEGQQFVAPRYVFSTTPNPLCVGRSASLSPHRWPSTRYPRQTISPDQSKDIAMWLGCLERAPNNLSVSMKRLILAATERMDHSDAFIDAITVWENMFGAKQEASFRIRAAMSLLIEPSNERNRQELAKEIRDLYNRRSRLVHGSPDVVMNKVYDDSNRSIELALEALRRVLSKRNLLNASGSEARGQAIILNMKER